MRRLLAGLTILSAASCCLWLTLLPRGANAQAYPSRSITIVVPSAAGGPGDISARLIADRMSAALGQPVIVENLPGVGGTVGMAKVARAAPDGYTLLVHQTGFAITPALYANLPFDTRKDFAIVGLINRSSVYFVGRKSLEANNLAELIAWMKGPGKPAKFAHPGAGTNGHLQSVVMLRTFDIDVTLIPYRGIAPAVNDLLGEHIDVTQVGAATSGPLLRDRKIKAYASTGTERDAAFPEIPTFAELGYKHLSRPFWHALFAPAATPKPVLEKISAALRDAVADETVQKNYANSGVTAYPVAQRTIEAGTAHVQAEFEFWQKIVHDNNIKIE
jgi:tripartite-type tricarboxylate transporter receptor subunit TctC